MALDRATGFPSAAQAGVMVGFPPPPNMRVHLGNWQLPPYNRWAVQHTRQVIPTANISRGVGASWNLGRAPADIENVVFETPEGAEQKVGDFLDHSWTDGLIVLKRGQIQFETYRNDMTAETRHIAFSVSKSITSLVIGVLVHQGLIDVDALATKYVPELRSTAFEGATIQNLLDMEVANAWHEDYVSDTTEFWRLDVACGWIPPRDDAAGSLMEFYLQTQRDGRHGERVQYSSLNPDLLALIAERVYGTPFPDVVSRELWEPMHAEFDADLTVDPAGMSVADGGYCITLRDFARIGQLFLNKGTVNGREVVSEEWIEECCRLNPKPFHPLSSGADLKGASYRNLWWRLDGRAVALGIHGQMMAIDHESDLVVVILSSPPEPTDSELRETHRRMVTALANIN